MIGCCIIIISLVLFDISHATFSMIRFNKSPREGHLKAAKRILSYLKTFPKGRIIVGTTYPDHSIYLIEDHPNRKYCYPEAEEEVPNDLSTPKVPKVKMTDFVDADHAHNLVFRRCITGILTTLIIHQLYGCLSIKRL
jgi:hypothetical protein